MDFLVKFFNVLFERGIYPDSWTESMIIPLFKKDNQNDPDNYRGISLCDISSKLYSSIINNTIQLYCLCVEKFAFWLVIYIKTFNKMSTGYRSGLNRTI